MPKTRRTVEYQGSKPTGRGGKLWGYGYADLARILGTTEGALRARVKRGTFTPGNLESVFREWAARAGLLLALAVGAIGCGEITVADGPDADMGQRGTGGHVLAEMGAGGRQEGAGGAVAQLGTGGAATAGVGGVVVVAGTGGRPAGGAGGMTSVGAGGAGGMTSVGAGGAGGVIHQPGLQDYPACASTGQPPHPNGCGNASHQQSFLNGYECADCAETSAPPGYSGFVPPSPTVPPYACLTPDYILCVVSCDLCR